MRHKPLTFFNNTLLARPNIHLLLLPGSLPALHRRHNRMLHRNFRQLNANAVLNCPVFLSLAGSKPPGTTPAATTSAPLTNNSTTALPGSSSGRATDTQDGDPMASAAPTPSAQSGMG
ncbi:hypothetical protein DXG01_003833 [Tephrocybe rancida]|nr:hypothetical protein DXG01_003833 [Tephrocybe rancida]